MPQNTLEASSTEASGELKLYSIDEVIKILGVSSPIVLRELANGNLVGRRISRAKLVFTAEDIRKYIANLAQWKDATSASQLQSPDVTE